MKESTLQRDIRTALETTYPNSVWWKVHGNMYQMSGLPDIVGCVYGAWCGFEVKTARGRVSPVQESMIERFRDAGGLAAIVYTPKQAVDVVLEHLVRLYGYDVKNRIDELSERRRQLCEQIQESSLVHATWHWKNTHRISSVNKSMRE